MATRRKRPKHRSRMRWIVSENVGTLMPQRFRQADKVKALAKAAGISRSSVQRVVNAQHGTSIDLIELMAEALDVMPHQLLMENRKRR